MWASAPTKNDAGQTKTERTAIRGALGFWLIAQIFLDQDDVCFADAAAGARERNKAVADPVGAAAVMTAHGLAHRAGRFAARAAHPAFEGAQTGIPGTGSRWPGSC